MGTGKDAEVMGNKPWFGLSAGMSIRMLGLILYKVTLYIKVCIKV